MSEAQNLGEFDVHVAKRYQVSNFILESRKKKPKKFIYVTSFKMEKRLGRGAYGIVWKAKTRKSNRVVTISFVLFTLHVI